MDDTRHPALAPIYDEKIALLKGEIEQLRAALTAAWSVLDNMGMHHPDEYRNMVETVMETINKALSRNRTG